MSPIKLVKQNSTLLLPKGSDQSGVVSLLNQELLFKNLPSITNYRVCVKAAMRMTITILLIMAKVRNNLKARRLLKEKTSHIDTWQNVHLITCW